MSTTVNSTKRIPLRELSQLNIRESLGMSAEEFQAIGKMGAMFYQQGNVDKAQTIFEGMLELEPENDAVHSALGAVLTNRRQDDEALIHLNKAIKINETEIASFVNRAEVYLRKSEVELAIADLKWAIQLDPLEKDPGANRARAMVLGIHQAIEAQNAQKLTNN